MLSRVLLCVLASFFSSSLAIGRPEIPVAGRSAIAGSTPWARGATAAPSKAVVDTFYILGGPDRLDGKFEDATGAPDWNGWTHRDLNVSLENHWHVSNYWAAGLNGHGPENYALVCVDEDIPACDAPDTVGGVGTDWFDDIQWSGIVSNPLDSVTVRLTAFMHYDLADIDWDFLELHIVRGDDQEMLGQWTGTDYEVALDITTVLQPAELVGPDGDEVRIFWRVWSDSGYNDLDCKSPSHGAAQIDDISIYFNDELVSFSDFEPSSPMEWIVQEFSGVGDFASLRSNLPDLDPCNQNGSVQVTFIDDGVVVPGAGPTYCETHCYGPGGFILNNTGGLLADDTHRDWFLKNQIQSPPLPWVPGAEAAELAFDVYRHELFSISGAGIFFLWGVRSTASADPADLEYAPWLNRGFFHYGGPGYLRQIEPVSDLILPDAQWAQVQLVVTEVGWMWGINGTDGTPAPYFDNVSLKAWAGEGPEILVDATFLFMDAFPEQGVLNPSDLASNGCRIDNSLNLNPWGTVFVAGDSLVAEIDPVRSGAELFGAPQLHWVMACNPAFDAVRPAVPGVDGILRGSVPGTEVYAGTTTLPSKWAFDLPDTGWFFPGDRVRYYVTAVDQVAGSNPMMTSWPADTTGILDFQFDTAYPAFAEVRALPTVVVAAPGQFDQPSMLYLDEAGDDDNTDRMLRSLAELGFVAGADFDHYRTKSRGGASIAGLAVSATAASLSGYQTITLEAGIVSSTSVSGALDSPDEQVFMEWLDQGDKRALLMGDGLIHGITYNDTHELADRLGIATLSTDISQSTGGERYYLVNPLAGNGVFPDDATWAVNGDCPVTRLIDQVFSEGSGVTLASLDVVGGGFGPDAAAIANTDTLLDNKVALLPYSFAAVVTDPNNPVTGSPNYSARTLLLKHFLDWFAVAGSGDATAVPDVRGLTFQVGPNPFNPRTTVAFDLPRESAVTLDIYDVQGRRVKQLLNETMAPGPHSQVWSGRDGQDRQVPSGIYFYRFTAGDQQRRGKLTLLK